MESAWVRMSEFWMGLIQEIEMEEQDGARRGTIISEQKN